MKNKKKNKELTTTNAANVTEEPIKFLTFNLAALDISKEYPRGLSLIFKDNATEMSFLLDENTNKIIISTYSKKRNVKIVKNKSFTLTELCNAIYQSDA